MAFKSEIHVAELASIRTGHTEGDIYYILDNGMLGDLPCKPGTFVKWHDDTWQIQPDEHYALASAVDGEIAQAIDNILDDGQAGETIVVAVPSSQSSDYTVGHYYEVQGKVARLRTKTDGDNVTQLTFDTGSGLLDAINGIVDNITNIGNPLQWKGPATVEQLNTGITGIQAGWTYTLTDDGTLTDGSITVEIGDEVAWTGTAWFKVGGPSSKIAVYWFSGTDYPASASIRADLSVGKTVVLVRTTDEKYEFFYLFYRDINMSHTQYQFIGNRSSLICTDGVWNEHPNGLVDPTAIAPEYDPAQTYPTVGTAVMHFGRRYVSNTVIGTAEAWTPAHWTLSSIESTIGSINNGGALTDAVSVNVPNNALSTLATAQATLTLNVNVGASEVPNFAVEVTPSVDCTLTVTKTVGSTTTTLNPSVAGGNSLTTGKLYQVTCVGSCWTLAEFMVPTP